MNTTPIFGNIAYDFFVKGGPIMYPILFCALAAMVVITERALWWWQLSNRGTSASLQPTFDAIAKGNFANADDLSSEASNPFLATINAGIAQAHTSLLGAMQIRAMDEIAHAEKRIWILGTLITLAPLLGLLGTVTGIMHSFDFVGASDLSAQKVSGGIAEALIATACGLGIAIACLLPFNYFNRRLARYRSELERVINHVEILAQSAKHHGHDLEEFARRRAVAAHSHQTGRPALHETFQH
jgi:biopolymer transport protein ExbB